MMRRRDLITLLGSATAWPLAARAQQPALPVIGYLSGRSHEAETSSLAAFRKGLAETGYVEGRNVAIEFRFADGHPDRLPALAKDLVNRQLAVVVAVGGGSTAISVRAANPSVPIVFNSGTDPVQAGLVASLNRPGGTITGVFAFASELVAKNLGLLHELVPKAATIAVLTGSLLPAQFTAQEREAHAAAGQFGLQVRIFNITAVSELDATYATLEREPPDAMLLLTAPLFLSRAQQIVEFAARLGIPAIYNRRDYPAAGGLMSYGDNFAEGYRYTGIYAGRILNGEKPANLPVQQPTKFELVINLKTAKARGIEVSPALLARADEVIEQ